jgi:hypothetical protein
MSFTQADAYNVPGSPYSWAEPGTAAGPNQASVLPPFSYANTPSNVGNAPAFSFLGIALLLLAWRVVIELGSGED